MVKKGLVKRKEMKYRKSKKERKRPGVKQISWKDKRQAEPNNLLNPY